MKDLKQMILAILVLSMPAVVRAGVDVSYSHTSGSNSFDSNTVDANLDLFSGLYVGASYNSYQSDFSSGTIKTYYGRLGRVTDNGSWKLFGFAIPEVNNYKGVGGGGEFRTALIGRNKTNPHTEIQPGEQPSGQQPGPAEQEPSGWQANPRLDLMGGYTRLMFTDQGQKIDENDLTGGLGFNLYKTYLSGTFTKSVYDEEISGKVNLNQRRFNLGITPTILPGYPDYAYTASVDQTLFAGWYLLGSYTHLKFKASPDDIGNLVSFGAGVRLFSHILGTAMYTRYFPAGNPTQNFFTIGGGLEF